MACDQLSARYHDLLDGSYDCVDRLVVNAYNYSIQSGGGFRHWWRALHGGDENLDDTHLMRYAGRFARRVGAFAAANRIPLIQCKRGDDRRFLSEDHLPADPAFRGLYCIIAGHAPAAVREVIKCSNGQPHIRTKYSYVKMYLFHIIDPEWGHVIVRFCPHPPFNAQVIVNGHEFVERHASSAQLSFTKEGNCFTNISDAAALARVADAMTAASGEGRLAQVCERWIYSTCLCFALDIDEQKRTNFRYGYSVFQIEYSRNFLFTRGRVLEQVFQSLIDRTRAALDIKTVRTIFGSKKRPCGRRNNRCEVVVERPAYDLTVFKIHFKRLTVKIYSKGERVLRIEAIAHNTKDLRSRRGIENLPAIVAELKTILERFVDVLDSVNASFIDAGKAQEWSEPSVVAGRRVAGLDTNRARIRAVMEAASAVSTIPGGFTASDHAGKVREILGLGDSQYQPRHASYDLKKLRAKNLVRKIEGTRRYEAPPDGLRPMAAFLVLRDKVLTPLLANAAKPAADPDSPSRHPIDIQYERIQAEMKILFEHVGIAA